MPYYVLGNACLGAWATAYWYNHISLAQIILFVAIASQLCPIWFTLKNAAREQKNTRADGWTTMIVAKVLLGTLVMYLWKTWGAIDVQTPVPPSIPQKVHSGIVFVFYTITSGPDPTLGLVLIYVLLTLWLGPYQNAGWHNFFIIQSLILAVLLILERLLSRLNLNTDNQTSTSDIPNEPDIGYGYGYEDSFTSPTPRRSRDSNSSACGHTDG
ncbi:hypothetical protein BDP27DRAFT_923745 [Rhodocollybia butyracea]|uniref:Uncharacterized protein n=1 Tax=Rhodocollybia butyracea TaxID=206335 RepID=A0A9P5PSJ2_9AGAR|nr:hypothetical protein BDP27DRAFT_923745 [Rhodocollybia butyracea]